MKKLFFTLLFSASCFFTNAQSGKLVEAFTVSYQLETKADYVGAIKTLKGIYDPKSYEINLRLAWLNYEAGLFSESINYYETSIALMPYSIEAKFGYVYPASALGNWDKVTLQYNKILAIDPHNTSVNYKLGMIYYAKKDFVNAYKCFEKIINLYPFGYDALIMYAWCNYQMEKTREAKVLFNKVLLISPGDASALEGLSLIK